MDQMAFPKTIKEFIDDYSFKDKEEIYTNGSQLIQTFRVEQALNHYYQPYKDIEDELGIDIVTLFKALKKGIWIYDNGNPFFTSSIKLAMQLDAIYCSISDIEVLLKDYGKTWALTREELEND